jgi:hypothetical protein
MPKYAEKAIARNRKRCLESRSQEVVEVEAVMVFPVATPDALEQKGHCHGKEDRFAGALAGEVFVVVWEPVVPRQTHSAWT